MQEVSLRGRIFYGWWLLVGLFLIYAASNGILLNTMPRIFPNLAAEFGWTNEQVTRPANMFFALVAFLNPVAGWLLDRYSIRRLMLIGTMGITLVLALYPMVEELWQLMALYVLFAFSLSLAGLSPSLMLLSRWFVRYRGLAFGILMMASSLGGAAFPWLVNYFLPDWRLAVWVLAVLGGAMMILPTLFLVSNYPRDKGLAADGVADPEPEIRPAPDRFTKVLANLVRSPVFYLLAFATGTLWFCIVAMLNNQALYLQERTAAERPEHHRDLQQFLLRGHRRQSAVRLPGGQIRQAQGHDGQRAEPGPRAGAAVPCGARRDHLAPGLRDRLRRGIRRRLHHDPTGDRRVLCRAQLRRLPGHLPPDRLPGRLHWRGLYPPGPPTNSQRIRRLHRNDDALRNCGGVRIRC